MSERTVEWVRDKHYQHIGDIVEVDKARLFLCHGCGFSYDARHTVDGTDDEYRCPECELTNISRLHEEMAAVLGKKTADAK